MVAVLLAASLPSLETLRRLERRWGRPDGAGYSRRMNKAQPANLLLSHDGDAKELAARLAGLLDAAMDAIITLDESQQVVQYNLAAEKIFGWPVAQVLDGPLDKLIPERFRAAHGKHVRHFGATGATSRGMGDGTVLYGLRANGQEFPMEASISQLATTHGKLFTVILRDVSERMRAQEELRAFAVQAHHVREEEKARVARELHDELAQSLTTLKMDAAWMRDRLARESASQIELTGKLATMQATLDHAVAATRRIASDLRPLILDDLGLAAALEWLVNGFIKRSGIACTLEMEGEVELAEPFATAVFRIVQESLNNVAKHAHASKVQVRIAHDGKAVMLSICDDGCGFDAQAPRRPEALGLAGLRERAHLLRGSADIRSQEGSGTTVEVRIPLG